MQWENFSQFQELYILERILCCWNMNWAMRMKSSSNEERVAGIRTVNTQDKSIWPPQTYNSPLCSKASHEITVVVPYFEIKYERRVIGCSKHKPILQYFLCSWNSCGISISTAITEYGMSQWFQSANGRYWRYLQKWKRPDSRERKNNVWLWEDMNKRCQS